VHAAQVVEAEQLAERDYRPPAEETAGQPDHDPPYQRIGPDEPQPVEDVAVGRAPIDASRRGALAFGKVETGDQERRQQEGAAVAPERERCLVVAEEMRRVEVSEPFRESGGTG